MIPLLATGLKNIGVSLRETQNTHPEILIKNWTSWQLADKKVWQANYLHRENSIRTHDHDVFEFRGMAILTLTLFALFLVPLPYRDMFIVITAFMLITMIEGAFSMIKPITSVAPSLIGTKNISPKTIRDELENFIAKFRLSPNENTNARALSL